MAWLCPTYQRPERLAELAISWRRHAPGKKLYVRVWKDDPRLEDYQKVEWPEEWELYEGDYKGAGASLREMWRMLPDEKSYGFIGDDIVLRTPGAIDLLEKEAGDWFIAYPDDTIQRNRLPTHFCIGGKLTNVLGWIVPNNIQHGYMDMPIMNLGLNTGLLRYCPHIIFHHKHFTRQEAEFDASYQEMYTEEGRLREDKEDVVADKVRLDEYMEKYWREDITKVQKALIREFEDQMQWDQEDQEAAGA
jgi:hypothetical protein